MGATLKAKPLHQSACTTFSPGVSFPVVVAAVVERPIRCLTKVFGTISAYISDWDWRSVYAFLEGRGFARIYSIPPYASCRILENSTICPSHRAIGDILRVMGI